MIEQIMQTMGFSAQIDLLTLDLTILAIIVGLIILKGMALWKAARLKEKTWFWFIFWLNTLGILPGVYLYLRRKKKV